MLLFYAFSFSTQYYRRPSEAATQPSTAAEEQLSDSSNKKEIDGDQEVEDKVVINKDDKDPIPVASRCPADVEQQSTSVDVNLNAGEDVEDCALETDGTPTQIIQANVTINFQFPLL